MNNRWTLGRENGISIIVAPDGRKFRLDEPGYLVDQLNEQLQLISSFEDAAAQEGVWYDEGG